MLPLDSSRMASTWGAIRGFSMRIVTSALTIDAPRDASRSRTSRRNTDECASFHLLSLDDQGDKARTEANCATLAANQQVVGLAGFTTRPCSEAGAVFAAKENMALVGAFSGTPAG